MIITLAFIRDFEFASLEYLWLVFAIPFLFAVYFYGFRMKNRALIRFASEKTAPFFSSGIRWNRQYLKSGLVLIAFLMVLISLMRPRGDPTEEQIIRRGRDVCFVLDVSKSMLAEDIRPNRLERAKIAIRDVVDIMEGDRVGLIVFAGNVTLKCPLTTDYHFFRRMLDTVSTRDATRGGTNVGDAIREAVRRVLDNQDAKYRDIILITDGEDLEESLPVNAAEYASSKGVRINAVGIGDPEGSPVPDTDNRGRILMFNGEPVMSRLDEETLRKIALATPGGSYIPVRTGTMDLGELYRTKIAPADKQDYDAEIKTRWREWFQVPLLVAVLLLIAEFFIGDRKESRETTGP